MDSGYIKPKDLRKLRACTGCRLLKPESQWNEEKRCENCQEYSNVTKKFNGVVCYTDPRMSWVAKWLDCKLIPGLYCISIDNDDNDKELDKRFQEEDENEDL